MTIIINETNIRIRPSAVDTFYSCAYQWGKVFLEGKRTIPNARAAIGTSIHAAVEQMWNEAIASKTKQPNISAMTDAAVETWKEQTHDGVQFDDGENANTAIVEVIRGAEAFIDDILPFAEIPNAVEKFYKIDISGHPIVAEIGGTIDYITDDTVADVKTSKRKIAASGHTTQQSIYTYLAQANGEKIEHNMIHGVVLNAKKAEGSILTLEPAIPTVKLLINTMLDTLELIAKDTAPIETILRGNTKHYLCSPKYCNEYNTCPFVNGKA